MFCLHCGKEIPDQSTFCMVCGKPSRVVPAREMGSASTTSARNDRDEKSGPHTGRLLLGLFIAGVIAWILFIGRSNPNGASSGRSALRPFSQKLTADAFAIKPAQYFYQTFTVGNTLVSPHVVGSFHASGGIGNDIQVVLAEKGEFENWVNGHQARLLYSSGKTTNGQLDVQITEPGTYFLGFSNAFSLLSAKAITADIELQYLTR